MWNNSLCELRYFLLSQKAKLNLPTFASANISLRSNFTPRSGISLAREGKFSWKKHCFRSAFFMAPPVGLEPTTCGLTVRRSTDWAKGEYLCSHYLSSQAVARQVLSAQMSLTSVFGMGTGGPSSQSTRTLCGWLWTTVISKAVRLMM